MNFEGVWDKLENSVPPEITHYQLGLHPGPNWWLKTAIPKQDNPLDLMNVWQIIDTAHPKLLKITPYCFDWQQNLISTASTIWIKQGLDVDLKFEGKEFNYTVLSSDVTFNIWGSEIRKHLRRKENRNLKENDPETWQKMDHVAQLLKSWTTEKQAQVRRQMLRVITNEKDSSSSTNAN